MLLQPLRWCLILQAISTVYGRLEIKNSSSLPPSSSYGTSSTVVPDLKATPSSTSIDGLSTTADLALNVSSTLLSSSDASYPHVNAGKHGSSTPLSSVLNTTTSMNSSLASNVLTSLKTLTAGSDVPLKAENVGNDVSVLGIGPINVTLKYDQLTFGFCVDNKCKGKILVCYDSDTTFPPSHDNPQNLCGKSGQCGFQIEMDQDSVYPMLLKPKILKEMWLKIEGTCSSITMVAPEIQMMYTQFKSCAPRIVNHTVTLDIKHLIDDCPLKIIGAQLKPQEASTTSTRPNESTAEESSSATTIWIVVGCLIFAFALLGLVAFAIWFFKLRHRKAKPAKTQPAPTEVAAPTDKLQTQVQVKHEIKNDDAGVKKDLVPGKTGPKIAVDTPAKVKSELKTAVETPTKPVEPAKVKAAEAAHDELKTVECNTAGNSTVPPTVPAAPPATPAVDPAVWNEKVQTRAKSAMKTFSLRSGKSAKSGQKKPDSALLRLQASNEYRKLEPIHSLSRVYGIYDQTAKDTARLYPPGCLYPDACVKALLLGPADFAIEFCNHLSADAHQTLVEYGVEFDKNGNTTQIPQQARRMVRESKIEEHIKACLFLAEFGKDFEPTPAILSKLSAPLLFIIALGTRYSDQLREEAIVEMRRHLPMIRKCWSYEERLKCHFPINGIEQAYKLNKRTFRKNADLKSRSSSSGREAAYERQKQREIAERAKKREKRR